MNASLQDIVSFLDERLRIREIEDLPGAWNGLQIANTGKVARIAAGVDASLAVLRRAGEVPGTLLLVHHGLFWGEIRPMVGAQFKKFASIIRSDLAVYSAHLPLDVHPEVGNNALLMRALGFKPAETFYPELGTDIGLVAEGDMSISDLAARVETAVGGSVRLLKCGLERVRRVGVVTGGAGSGLHKAAAARVDTFVTGEGPHHTFALAQELRLNVIYAGHYATETFGVKALAAETAGKFGLPWEFLDSPSGL